MGAKIWVVAGLLLVLAACQGAADLPVQPGPSPTSSQSTPTVPTTPAPAELVLRAAPAEVQQAPLPVSVPPAKPMPGTEPEPTQEPEPGLSGFEDTVWVTDSVDEMQAALDQGQHPEEQLEEGWLSGLHVVAAYGDPAVMEFLLDWGADIMLPDRTGATPLHYASRSGTPEMVGLLIDRGAEVRNVDENGGTPLADAAMGNPDPRVAELLLDRGARLDFDGGITGTPLQAAAAYNENPEIALVLLERGADPWRFDAEGSTLLHNAAEGGHTRLVESLLDMGFDVNALSDANAIPLHDAAAGGNPEVVAVLLRRGSDIDAKGYWFGWTPLHVAVSFHGMGYHKGTVVDVIDVLLQAGHLVDARDDNGRTPLHLVAEYEGWDDPELAQYWSARWGEPTGPVEVMDVLLERGANPSAQDHNFFTPLHVAVDSEDLGRVRLLLDRGADIHKSNQFGETACGNAGWRDIYQETDVLEQLCGEFVSWLTEDFWSNADAAAVQAELDAGADPQARDGAGRTVFHVATEVSDDSGVIEILLDRGADIEAPVAFSDGERPLHIAAVRSDPSFAEVLLERGADIDGTDGNNRTPLHAAALHSGWSGTATLELLLSWGANVEAKDNLGRTPLFAAVTAVSEDAPVPRGPTAIRLLRERGARLDVVDETGGTLLHHGAAHRRVTAALVEFLIGEGIPVDAKNSDGETALDMTSSRTSDRVIRLLEGPNPDYKPDFGDSPK